MKVFAHTKKDYHHEYWSQTAFLKKQKGGGALLFLLFFNFSLSLRSGPCMFLCDARIVIPVDAVVIGTEKRSSLVLLQLVVGGIAVEHRIDQLFRSTVVLDEPLSEFLSRNAHVGDFIVLISNILSDVRRRDFNLLVADSLGCD